MLPIRLIFLALIPLTLTACAHTPVNHDMTLPPPPIVSDSMMIPTDALLSPSGYAYIVLSPPTGGKPPQQAAVDVYFLIRDATGTITDETKATLAMWHSTPFLEEILSLMSIGETVRVWGESRTRIWEISLLGINENYNAPPDAARPPLDASATPQGASWRLIELGDGKLPKPNQVIRFHATRWRSTGEILESNRASSGLLLPLNDQLARTDPLHYERFLDMPAGTHIRIWIPAHVWHGEVDVVEDLWLTEIVEILDPPTDLEPPADLAPLMDGVWFLSQQSGRTEQNLKPGQIIHIDITCWKSPTGELIEASRLRPDHHEMVISDNLGTWQNVMTNAHVEEEFRVWLSAHVLPMDIDFDMTCHVKIIDAQDVIH